MGGVWRQAIDIEARVRESLQLTEGRYWKTAIEARGVGNKAFGAARYASRGVDWRPVRSSITTAEKSLLGDPVN